MTEDKDTIAVRIASPSGPNIVKGRYRYFYASEAVGKPANSGGLFRCMQLYNATCMSTLYNATCRQSQKLRRDARLQ
jgi:hypothetical protein